jgi:formylmethanofuran dehydrogenase subunit E
MTLDEILRESASRHKHLCPRQVLGARMALYAAEILDMELPRTDKRLLVISETDGCTVDGIIAATACRVGSRTLRIHDLGKVAATFIDIHTEETIRVVPRREIRILAADYAPGARNRWEAMLLGYQVIPAVELFAVQHVKLDVPLLQIISKPGKKAICEICNEEIINGREILKGATILCRGCTGEIYYHFLAFLEKSDVADSSHKCNFEEI